MAEHLSCALQVLCTLSVCCWLLTGVWPRTGEQAQTTHSFVRLPESAQTSLPASFSPRRLRRLQCSYDLILSVLPGAYPHWQLGKVTAEG